MNSDFVLMTDDSCDLPREYLTSHNIEVIQLSYTIDGTEYRSYDVSPKGFYDFLRQGKMPVTAQVNVEDMRLFMEPFLEAGRDVLYIAFSSGLSGTCNSGVMAATELQVVYPGRKVIVVDSLAASLGQGLMIYKVQQMREQGMVMEDIAKWVEDNRDHVAHLVAVEDLMHLHRGGRVSKMSAIAGSMLGIKPIIHLDVDGKLKVIDKVRGRKQSLMDIVKKMQDYVGDTPNDFFMVCHADCEEDAQYVADLVTERFGIKDYLINYIGPVIGSHTGCGVVALFMMAKHK
jgi:DegV family protein with EDD domain